MLWQQDGFALAEGYDEETGRYRGLVLPSDRASIAITDSTLIVHPALATEQRDRETAATAAAGGGVAVAPGETPVGPAPTPPVAPKPVGKTRFFGTKELSSDGYAKDFKKITDEGLTHLAATPGVDLHVTLEIEATTAAGFDENRVRTVSENAKTLKFEQSGFEES